MKKLISIVLAALLLAGAFPARAAIRYDFEVERGGLVLGQRRWAVLMRISEASAPDSLKEAYAPADLGEGVAAVRVLAPASVAFADEITLLEDWMALADGGKLSPVDEENAAAYAENAALLETLRGGWAAELLLYPEDPAARESAVELYARLKAVGHVRQAAAGTAQVSFTPDFDLSLISTAYGDMLPGLVPQVVSVVSLSPEEDDAAGSFALRVGLYKPIDSAFPYASDDLGFSREPLLEPVFDSPEEEAAYLRAAAEAAPNGAYAPAYLGLADDEVARILPTEAYLSSRYYDDCTVFLNDDSLPSALEAAARARSAPGVYRARVVSAFDAKQELDAGYCVIAYTQNGFLTGSPTPGDFGEAVALALADAPADSGQELIAGLTPVRLYLKDPTRENAVALIRELKEKPFVRVAYIEEAFYMDNFLVCDADGDGKVTAGDARLILRFAVGLETPLTRYAAWVADRDNNGRWDAGDARHALRVAVGLEREEHVC